MWDDPRWGDPRERDNNSRDLSRGSRGASSDPREAEPRDPRDVFVRHVDLPRGPERTRVRFRDREYMLRGSESRTLATVGAFRVVPAGDLRDDRGRPLNPRSGDLRNLREQGLVSTIPAPGQDRAYVMLTERGRELLEASRRSPDKPNGSEPRQEFYRGLQKPRELTHDAQVYRAYLQTAERLQGRGANIERVVLDAELKRDYQRFLQERNRGRSDSDGRPDRSVEEIQLWARQHDLPERDGHVQSPDARIEYCDVDSRTRWEDIEVETVHYRGGLAASKASAGFTRYSGSSLRILAARGSTGACGGAGRTGGKWTIVSTGRSGRGIDPRLAEDLLR
jgi:DNA-binding PadR family transcriptional regulator